MHTSRFRNFSQNDFVLYITLICLTHLFIVKMFTLTRLSRMNESAMCTFLIYLLLPILRIRQWDSMHVSMTRARR